MGCKSCASENRRELPVEISIAFPSPQELKVSPVYLVQTLLVCLDCGFSELVIPKAELKHLRDAAA